MKKKRPSNLLLFHCNPINFSLLFIFVYFSNFFQISLTNSIYEDYEECRDRENFGNFSLICDTEHKLQRATLQNLDTLLRDLQNKITCECSNDCKRGEGLSNKYIGLLIVTNSKKINLLTASEKNIINETESEKKLRALTETAKQIFEDAKLGNKNCDNGLLILYVKDQQKLATYRGQKRFALLNDDDMNQLYKLAFKGKNSQTANNGDSVALRYLISNYEEQRRADENVFRAESWAPMFGLIIALLVVLIIFAILVAFLLAKLCCCCSSKNNNKEKYYVNHASTYKNIEPIYIVTPALSQNDAASNLHQPNNRPRSHSLRHSPVSLINADYSIYNSPYGTARSPLPPPPPPLPPFLYNHRNSIGPIITHPPRSRSVTPISNHRTKVQQTRDSQVIRSPDQTPQAYKRDHVNRTSTIMSKNSNGTYYTASYIGGPNSSTINNNLSQSPKSDNSIITVSRPTHSHHPMEQIPGSSASESDEVYPLPFLDPRRKREVQTKEQFIS